MRYLPNIYCSAGIVQLSGVIRSRGLTGIRTRMSFDLIKLLGKLEGEITSNSRRLVSASGFFIRNSTNTNTNYRWVCGALQ